MNGNLLSVMIMVIWLHKVNIFIDAIWLERYLTNTHVDDSYRYCGEMCLFCQCCSQLFYQMYDIKAFENVLVY